jgi:hypothetical protein
MIALTCGFDVWLSAMNVDELIQTKNAAERDALIAFAQRFLASGRCVWPPHEIINLLIAAHEKNPTTFDWRTVDVRAGRYKWLIVQRDYTDSVCAKNAEPSSTSSHGRWRHGSTLGCE